MAGCRLIVVTNQSAVGRGYMTEARLSEVHERLKALLAAESVQLDSIYACVHTPWDGCRCRKPLTGLVRQAEAEWGFDARSAFMIGDNAADIQLGINAGATTILVRTGYGATLEATNSHRADFVVDGLADAAAYVLRTSSVRSGPQEYTHPAQAPHRPTMRRARAAG
jgi:D-glycero-D-manno-heptose 1,7-bisphosphate phosphatase